MIDEVLSGMTKVDGVPGGMDNGLNVGVEDQPLSQQEEGTQHFPKEKPEPPICLELEGNP